METPAIEKGARSGLSRYTPSCERFWRRVDKSPECGCWNWTGGKHRGYGRFNVNKLQTLAHRFSYESIVGGIPNGLTIDHLCRNKSCVNPAHLEVVTRGENASRHYRALTTCGRGHAWTSENTGTHTNGRRYCRACKRLFNKKKP